MEEIKINRIIRLSKSCLGKEEKNAVMGVLDREYLGMGKEVQQFEKDLIEFFNRQVVCVANGTAALHLALQAVGISQGDEVLVQSLTYVASFQAISATGAMPVACDIRPDTLTIDLHDAEKRLTEKTKAIMPVHYSGGVGDLDGIYSFAEKHHLRVIEDAAHAFGTIYKRNKVGSFGDIACFSFDGIKNITSGEGGCIVTNDKDVIRLAQDLRLLGVEKDTEQRYSGGRSWSFNVKEQGWRYHMSNIMAAIGIEQLKRINEFTDKRKLLAKCYDELLNPVGDIECLMQNYDEVVPHIYVVKLGKGYDREKTRKDLNKVGIQTGIHYQPNHWLDIYRKDILPLIKVDEIYPRLLSLPLHPDLEIEDVRRVVDCLINSVVNNNEETVCS